MTTVTIQGQDVELSDNFLKLSPEEQNATVQGIARQMGIKPVAPAAAAPTTYGDRPDDPRFTQNAMDVKQVMRGVPVLGPLLGERASAGMSALANPVTGAGSQGQRWGSAMRKTSRKNRRLARLMRLHIQCAARSFRGLAVRHRWRSARVRYRWRPRRSGWSVRRARQFLSQRHPAE